MLEDILDDLTDSQHLFLPPKPGRGCGGAHSDAAGGLVTSAFTVNVTFTSVVLYHSDVTALAVSGLLLARPEPGSSIFSPL